jgi:hypothetical protein
MSTKRDKFFQMRVDELFLSRLDNLRRAEPDLPSRTEMARRLIELAFERSESGSPHAGREKKGRASSNVGTPRPRAQFG